MKDESLESLLEDDEPSAKRKAKDSVFTNLFSDLKYTFQLYRALHPDDTETVKDDLILMTMESHLLNQQFNDLGFLVGHRLIILVEAQSTWSENIVIRVLLYVIQTWYKYIKRMKLDVYGEAKIKLPEPELYVIYTGKEQRPSELSLKENFFDGKDISIDCKVKVLSGGQKGDIISQYVRFCHVFDEQVKINGRTRKAVEETIRICQSEDVLREYLERQREEVIDIMITLFDEETIQENFIASERRKAKEEGRLTEQREIISTMLRNGRSPEDIASFCGFPLELVKQIEESILVK